MEAGLDEQMIMNRTGHRSIEAVRMYKRPSSVLQKQVSDILQPPAPKVMKSDGDSKFDVKSEVKSDIDAKEGTCSSRVSVNTASSSLGAPLVSSAATSSVGDASVSSTAASCPGFEGITITITRGDKNVNIKM